ncbi:MAG TPA: copper amine oxidase N-terminal domain-containing protein, partial [Candidatus Monoglobus merdigallinarum]|nr:copper amine oxidase N-terminal domain-containing protein [Candidatus Monoglobus merdigallinarum]
NGDIKNPIFEYYLCNENNKYEIIYENSTTDVGSYSWSESAQWCKICSIQNDNEEKMRFVTFDGIYKSLCLPAGLQTQTSYVMWATEDYVFIDVDRETYYRIPIDDTFKQNVIVRLNDKILGFSQPPVTESDRTLVPMRFLFEQMGAEVTWDDATQTATATISNSSMTDTAFSKALRTLPPRLGMAEYGLGNQLKGKAFENTGNASNTNTVTFSIDNTTATVNGSTATMDVPARLINDKTMVPLRFLSENLGFDVSWDEETRTAIVTTE